MTRFWLSVLTLGFFIGTSGASLGSNFPKNPLEQQEWEEGQQDSKTLAVASMDDQFTRQEEETKEVKTCPDPSTEILHKIFLLFPPLKEKERDDLFAKQEEAKEVKTCPDLPVEMWHQIFLLFPHLKEIAPYALINKQCALAVQGILDLPDNKIKKWLQTDSHFFKDLVPDCLLSEETLWIRLKLLPKVMNTLKLEDRRQLEVIYWAYRWFLNNALPSNLKIPLFQKLPTTRNRQLLELFSRSFPLESLISDSPFKRNQINYEGTTLQQATLLLLKAIFDAEPDAVAKQKLYEVYLKGIQISPDRGESSRIAAFYLTRGEEALTLGLFQQVHLEDADQKSLSNIKEQKPLTHLHNDDPFKITAEKIFKAPLLSPKEFYKKSENLVSKVVKESSCHGSIIYLPAVDFYIYQLLLLYYEHSSKEDTKEFFKKRNPTDVLPSILPCEGEQLTLQNNIKATQQKYWDGELEKEDYDALSPEIKENLFVYPEWEKT